MPLATCACVLARACQRMPFDTHTPMITPDTIQIGSYIQTYAYAHANTNTKTRTHKHTHICRKNLIHTVCVRVWVILPDVFWCNIDKQGSASSPDSSLRHCAHGRIRLPYRDSCINPTHIHRYDRWARYLLQFGQGREDAFRQRCQLVVAQHQRPAHTSSRR